MTPSILCLLVIVSNGNILTHANDQNGNDDKVPTRLGNRNLRSPSIYLTTGDSSHYFDMWMRVANFTEDDLKNMDTRVDNVAPSDGIALTNAPLPGRGGGNTGIHWGLPPVTPLPITEDSRPVVGASTTPSQQHQPGEDISIEPTRPVQRPTPGIYDDDPTSYIYQCNVACDIIYDISNRVGRDLMLLTWSVALAWMEYYQIDQIEVYDKVNNTHFYPFIDVGPENSERIDLPRIKKNCSRAGYPSYPFCAQKSSIVNVQHPLNDGKSLVYSTIQSYQKAPVNISFDITYPDDASRVYTRRMNEDPRYIVVDVDKERVNPESPHSSSHTSQMIDMSEMCEVCLGQRESKTKTTSTSQISQKGNNDANPPPPFTPIPANAPPRASIFEFPGGIMDQNVPNVPNTNLKEEWERLLLDAELLSENQPQNGRQQTEVGRVGQREDDMEGQAETVKGGPGLKIRRPDIPVPLVSIITPQESTKAPASSDPSNLDAFANDTFIRGYGALVNSMHYSACSCQPRGVRTLILRALVTLTNACPYMYEHLVLRSSQPQTEIFTSLQCFNGMNNFFRVLTTAARTKASLVTLEGCSLQYDMPTNTSFDDYLEAPDRCVIVHSNKKLIPIWEMDLPLNVVGFNSPKYPK